MSPPNEPPPKNASRGFFAGIVALDDKQAEAVMESPRWNDTGMCPPGTLPVPRHIAIH
jgi:hypothetical protein